MSESGGGAEAHARFEANSSLVLSIDSRARDTHEPTGEPESLHGRIDPRDRAYRGRPAELDEKLTDESKKKKERDPGDAGNGRQSKKRRRLQEESVLTNTEEGVCQPKTKETRAGQPLNIVSGDVDEILAVLKNPDKKKDIEKLLNPIPGQVFDQLVSIGRLVTDFQEEDAGGGDADGNNAVNDDDVGVAVEFEENDEDGDRRSNGMQMGGGMDDDDEESQDGNEDIDAYWLQRKISQAYDPQQQIDPQTLAEEVLKILEEGDEGEVEKKLVSHLQFDKFSGLIKSLLRNRLKIVWCTRLARAQDDKEKRKQIEEEMTGMGPDLVAILQQLQHATAKERQLLLEKSIREDESGGVAADNAVNVEHALADDVSVAVELEQNNEEDDDDLDIVEEQDNVMDDDDDDLDFVEENGGRKKTSGDSDSSEAMEYVSPPFSEISSQDYERALTYKSRWPCLIRIMKACHLSLLHLPARISEKLPPPSNKRVELVVYKNEKTWRVKTICKKGIDPKKVIIMKNERKKYKTIEHHLSAGWSAFVRENDIRVGDVIIIELVKRELKVTTVRNPTPATTTHATDQPDERFEIRPDSSYLTRSSKVSIDSPRVTEETVYCHAFKTRKPKSECYPCSLCAKSFHIKALSEELSKTEINPKEWVCPSCRGKCQCKECKWKLSIEDYEISSSDVGESSSPPLSEPIHDVSVDICLKDKFKDCHEDLMLALDYIKKESRLKRKYNETVSSIHDLLALLGRGEEASKHEGYCEEEEEEEEEEETNTHTVKDYCLMLKENYKLLGAQCEISRVENGTSVLDTLRDGLIRKETYRRELANEYMDQRGHIRVYSRVRPPLTKSSNVFTINGNTITLIGGTQRCETKDFEFDLVFSDASQDAVYLEIKHLVDCAITGKKVSIFCYGRSGSGKTFTMMGPNPPPKDIKIKDEKKGIIPRAVEQLYRAIEECMSGDMEFVVEWHEYLGKSVTLLLKQQCSSKDYSKEKMLLLLEDAHSKRATQETKLNKTSSRSHSMMEIKIKIPSLKKPGLLCLVDLAGDERPEGDTGKEGKAINIDLLYLKTLLKAHAGNSSKAVYRNSKLNERLKPFLSRESMILTMIHINHESTHADIAATLQFGHEALLTKFLNKKKKKRKTASAKQTPTETQTHSDHESPILEIQTRRMLKVDHHKSMRKLLRKGIRHVEKALKEFDKPRNGS